MTDLDELMSRDPLELSAQDIDTIIAYQRRAHAGYVAGEKPKKQKESVTVDTAVLGLRPPVKVRRVK